jgi:hypothetical protein
VDYKYPNDFGKADLLRSQNDLKITSYSVNGADRNHQPSKIFKSLLYPTPNTLAEGLRFPEIREVLGDRYLAVDVWQTTWRQGMREPERVYETSDYWPVDQNGNQVRPSANAGLKP